MGQINSIDTRGENIQTVKSGLLTEQRQVGETGSIVRWDGFVFAEFDTEFGWSFLLDLLVGGLLPTLRVRCCAALKTANRRNSNPQLKYLHHPETENPTPCRSAKSIRRSRAVHAVEVHAVEVHAVEVHGNYAPMMNMEAQLFRKLMAFCRFAGPCKSSEIRVIGQGGNQRPHTDAEPSIWGNRLFTHWNAASGKHWTKALRRMLCRLFLPARMENFSGAPISTETSGIAFVRRLEFQTRSHFMTFVTLRHRCCCIRVST